MTPHSLRSHGLLVEEGTSASVDLFRELAIVTVSMILSPNDVTNYHVNVQYNHILVIAGQTKQTNALYKIIIKKL